MTDWLSDTLAMTTALMLLVLIIRQPVAKHFGPSVAYWLWLIPAARLFMPSIEKAVETPASGEMATAFTTDILPTMTSMQNLVQSSPSAVPVDWMAIILTLWLGGAALFFVIQMIRYSDMRDELLTDAENLGQVGTVRLISSDRIEGPLAFGLFERFIVVPDNFYTHFSTEEAALAIEHEMSHHKSGDLFVNLLAFMVLCLNWFNPVAWMAWRAFRLDQEAACDARVLAGRDAQCRHTYGRTLARATQDGPPIFAPTFATALNSPKTIIERLRRLAMNNDSNRRRIAGRIGIFGAIALALPMTATVVPVWAHDPLPSDTAADPTAKKTKKVTRIEIRRGENGEKNSELHRELLDIEGDKATPFVKTIQVDGKTIVLRTSRELSDSEAEAMVAEAEKSRAEAEAGLAEAEVARAEADAELAEAEKEAAENKAREKRYIIIKKHKNEDGNKGVYYTAPQAVEARMVRSSHPTSSSHHMRVSFTNGTAISVRISPSNYGFPATEATYAQIAKLNQHYVSEPALLKTTLSSLRMVRTNLEEQCNENKNIDRGVITALDREIRHIEEKIRRAEGTA